MFTHVVALLRESWSHLSSGTVTVCVIRKLEKHVAQMRKLFDVSPKGLGLSIDVVELRIQELKFYTDHLKGIHHFCSSFSVPVKGTCTCRYIYIRHYYILSHVHIFTAELYL